MRKALRFWKRMPLWRHLAALAGVALVSVVIEMVLEYAHIANISMLYLIVVLAAAIRLGRGPAIVASMAAFLTFNWFFTPPRHTFAVADPAEWMALILFLVTAVTASQLAASQRHESLEAQRREREAVVLYDVTRLLGDPDLDRALAAVAERLRRELRSAVVAIDVADGELVRTSVESGDERDLAMVRMFRAVPSRLLGAGSPPSGDRRGTPGRWIRVVPPDAAGERHLAPEYHERLHAVPIRALDRRIGALLLLREVDAPPFNRTDDRLLSAVASQLGQTTDRARLRREATEAEILRRTDELRRALLNAVSHDLRTPLATILAGAESLLQLEGSEGSEVADAFDPSPASRPEASSETPDARAETPAGPRGDSGWTAADRREFAASIRAEALRLNRIVDNLLDLSRIEAGNIRPQKEWHDLRTLVAEVLGRLRPLTAPREVTLAASTDLPPVELDYVEIDQVVSNIVENAAKYTPAGTPIAVAIRQRGGEAVVEVVDRGPGILPADLPHLFEPFYRGDSARPSSRGSGLGLAVARGLVEAHGGRVWAENLPGGGARFALALPLGATGIPVGDESPTREN